MDGRNPNQDLGGPLLASVSRSFYLSIKVLPPEVREPLGLAYLLARTTDTVADTAQVAVELRLRHLENLERMVRGERDDEKIALLQKDIVPSDASEHELLQKIKACLAWLDMQNDEDRKDIVHVLDKIILGQRLDILRFPDRTGARALQNASELEEYTYLVAGCVGEFWTRICCRHVEHYSHLDEGTLCAMGINFGKGLQLVNILRDMPADLRAGRCYLPADELILAGVDPAKIVAAPEKARTVFGRWLARAGGYLDDAFQYIEVLKNRRIRTACILPWHIGMRTLTLISQKYPLKTTERVKVGRREVRRLLFTAPFAAMSNNVLRSEREELLGGLAAAGNGNQDLERK